MTTVDEARRDAHAALVDALMALRDKDPDALRLLLDTGSRDYAYAIAQRLVSASGVCTAAVRHHIGHEGKFVECPAPLCAGTRDALATPPAPVEVRAGPFRLVDHGGSPHWSPTPPAPEADR